MSRASALLLLASTAASAAPPFPACCAYGGSGAAVALGAGVLNAFSPENGGPPTGPGYAAPMAIGISPTRLFSTILFAAASGPDDSRAGWIVTSNATNDVIFLFSNVSESGPRCSAGVGPRGSFVTDYKLCGGAGGLFPQPLRDFQLTAATRVGVFAQASGATTLSFADETACAPLSLLGNNAPFGTGAFSINIESGVAAEPPASWSGPPAYCVWSTPADAALVESMRKA